ncbi:MAG: response regulator transcription factor [Bacteroidales bacterium]|nr:response regulator transcription factor [Bacteroidales bacterium]MBN2749876.1 response regulator transcription factor [Bacteroidales bacterium]
MTSITRIAIVDDHKILRDGLKALIQEIEHTTFEFEASNGLEFIKLLPNFNPDVVIMDISMPIMNGDEAVKQAKRIAPKLKVIVLSMHTDEHYFQTMKDLDVDGFIIKESDYNELELAINTVMKGGKYFSQQLLLNLIDQKNEKNQATLTPREIEIVKLLSLGMATIEIADKLNLSVRTIEKHRSELLLRTQSPNSISLIIYAIKNGVINI